MPTPTVVIVGRPNVGKSTLFNRITGQRRAIVGDEPGITRDRIHGFAEYDGRRFELIDTGGIVPDDSEFIPVADPAPGADGARARRAHHLAGGRPRRNHRARTATWRGMLRRLGKPVSLAVNKIDTAARENAGRTSSTSWASADVFPRLRRARPGRGRAGRAHRDGISRGDVEAAPEPQRGIRVAIIGRPNVGKSTLLNALTGQERAIVSPVAGTTRDAVDERITRDGTEYVFIDTAGIRRKGKTHADGGEAERGDGAAAHPHGGRGARPAGRHRRRGGPGRHHRRLRARGRARRDRVRQQVGRRSTRSGKRAFERKVRDELKFLEYAPVVFISAKTGDGREAAVPADPRSVRIGLPRITTGEMNRFVGIAALRGAQDLLHHAGLGAPADVRGVHRPRRALHFSARAVPGEPDPPALRLRGTPVVLKTAAARKTRARR